MYMEHFIFNTVGDNIISAGFSINSILMKKGLPPILTFDKSKNDEDGLQNNDDNIEDPVFKSFKHLAVPISLLSTPNKNMFNENEKRIDDDIMHSQIPDDLYDKLWKLVEYDNWKKRQSKKSRPSSNKRSSTYKRSRTK